MHNRKFLRIAVIGMRGIPSNYSGIERASENLYARLAERGHEVTIYCRPNYLDARTGCYRGMRLVRMPALEHLSLDSLSHACTSLIHAISAGYYDVIQIHAMAAGLFSPMRRLTKTPFVAKIHGLDWHRAKWKGIGSKMLKLAEKFIVWNTDAIIVVSRDLEMYFSKQYDRDTIYIPNGINELDSPKEGDTCVLGHFGLSPQRYVAYIGRLVPEKRIEDLIIAFRAIHGSWALAIVGEGQYTDKYVASLHKLAAADPRVIFTGLQRGAALSALYRQAAVYVLPSELEGLPNSLLECIGHGTPAIASDIPPHRELLGSVDGYDLFFRPGDIGALVDRLKRILSHREHYLQVAERAQHFVREFYSWDRSADDTEALFYSIVERASLQTSSRSF